MSIICGIILSRFIYVLKLKHQLHLYCKENKEDQSEADFQMKGREASWCSFYAASTPLRHRHSRPPLPLPLTFSSSERRSASRYAVSVGRISASTQSRKRGVSDRHTFRDGVARPSSARPSHVLVQPAPSFDGERNQPGRARAPSQLTAWFDQAFDPPQPDYAPFLL